VYCAVLHNVCERHTQSCTLYTSDEHKSADPIRGKISVYVIHFFHFPFRIHTQIRNDVECCPRRTQHTTSSPHKAAARFGGPQSSSSLSCTCTCIINHFFLLTDTAASASAILLQQLQPQINGPQVLSTLMITDQARGLARDAAALSASLTAAE
jgi:hypothetical protein